MKKTFLVFTALAFLGLAACSPQAEPSKPDPEPGPGPVDPDPEPETHTHTFSDTWTYDETNHWHAATCEHTEEKSDVAPHTLVKNADETEESCMCGYVHVLVSELSAPTNLAFADGVFSFDAVEHAKRYEVVAKQDDEVKYSETITETQVDLLSLEMGEYVVSVVAKAGDLSSQAATLNINQSYYRDGSRILEAEDYVINAKHISVDENAHGGKYALGFNDCGQGLYFQYYAFEAGERDIDVHYSTGAVGSYMKMFVGTDEDHPITVLFDEETGWFGDSHVSAVKTVKATLQKGWNDIYMFKDGTSTDYPEYGGWAQIDYIEIQGSNKLINSAEETVPALEHYRFEAEQADWHWADTYQRPNMSDAWSSHGYLGEQNALGDGVTFNINVQKAGTYLLKLAAGAVAAGRYYDITVNGIKENRHIQTGPAWNDSTPDAGFLVHLNQGANTIDFSRGANGDWSCYDYLLVDFVSENAPELPTEVANLAFADNTLTFDAAEGISEYHVVLVKDEEQLLSQVITGTSLEIPAAIHGENIIAAVYAKNGFFESVEGSTLTINPGVITDKDVKLEAELATIGEKHYSVDADASGGAYALGFDNCGEGMYFRYYAYEAGEREVEVCYATGAANSKMEFRVNSEDPVTVVFPENTGWFGDTKTTAKVSATINLQLGWNHIYLIKNGTDQDNPQYGGWVQVDYITIKGTGKSFDVSELNDLVCSSYKLEAESGNYSIIYARAPAMDSNFSIAYLGDQDEEGNGVTYKFYVDVAGEYKVQFYCGGEGSRKVSMSVNGNAIKDEGQDYYTVTTGNGWNVVAADPGFKVQLNQGWNTIRLARLSNEAGGGWICIDYCMVTLVA